MYARTFDSWYDVKTDTGFLPTSTSLSVSGGLASLVARPFTDDEKAQLGLYFGQQKTHDSGLISTQWHFEQTYGYWEVRAKLPVDAQGASIDGSWSAIWMLPSTKVAGDTTLNGNGQRPEIDIFEHQGGVTYVTSQGNQVAIDRRGNPFSTLHLYEGGAIKAVPFTRTASAATRIDLTQFHDFGLLWTPDWFITYVDGVEWSRVANGGRADDPHYLMVGHDFGAPGGAGWASAALPAALLVDRIRVYAPAP